MPLRLPVLRSLPALALVFCSWTPAAAPSASPEPLRLVSRSHADLGQLREALRWRIDNCQRLLQARGEPVSPVELPPDSVLRGVSTAEVEQLFDGYREARFATATQIWPDVDQGCRLRLRRALEAEVAELCGPHWWGRRLPELGSATVPARAVPQNLGGELAGLSRGQACLSTPEALPRLSAARASTVLGLECRWLEPEADGRQHCVHAQQPRYPVRKLLSGQGLLVLRTAFHPPAHHQPQALLAELDEGRSEAVSFEPGKAIAADRFAPAAIEQHLNQPLWLPLPAAER